MLGFNRTYTTPFSDSIPASVEDFFRHVPLYKRFKRFLGRYLYAEVVLRNSQKVKQISNEHQKILWVQWVDSYLGDSLMDLSGRVLIKDKKIDLLTKPSVASIYQNDPIFHHIFTQPEACDGDYDLLMISSYRQRELSIVKNRFGNLPHVSLYGYYNVDDFNRLYFSFYRLNQLTGGQYNQQQIASTAKPLLPITKQDQTIVEDYHLPENFIVIAIGGANPERTFNHWDQVVDRLLEEKITKYIVLVGSNNAQGMSALIAKMHPNQVVNRVEQCSFNQSAQIIKKSRLLVCADGGLLHAANAVQTPVVALFYYIDPMVRLIQANPSQALLDKENINHIKIDDIIKRIRLLSC